MTLKQFIENLFYDGIRFISYEDYEYLSINIDQTNAVAIV